MIDLRRASHGFGINLVRQHRSVFQGSKRHGKHRIIRNSGLRSCVHACPIWLALVFLLLSLQLPAADGIGAERSPNLVLILCDDLGYGDVHCLAPKTCQIETPGIDRLASEGMTFTDAHSGSSVCTPTRYGLLTGRYSWRTRLQRGVTTGFAPCLIDEGRPTVASFLRQQGYHTGIVGKWHLDFQYLDPKTGKTLRQKDHKIPPVGAKIPDGPLTRGFNYFHGFHHARNMKAVIEDDEVIVHEAEIKMLPRLTRKAVQYIDDQAASDPSQPFFLYVPLGSPHTPIVPSSAWQGKSRLGKYGDFVMETDAVVDQVLKALERNNLTKNTLVIFSSDNGCSKAAGIPKLAELGHKVSAEYRGSKADLWDGGHRVPFIVKWPGQVQSGTQCEQLICLTDVFATTAELLESEIPAGSCEDSVSFLPALKGQPIVSTRKGIVHHSFSGHFAYRQEQWKLLLARGSGGWTSPKENQVPKNAPEAQLYNMENDSGERQNLVVDRPELVKQLLEQLEADVTNGRSTEGPVSKNDVEQINLWKSGRGAFKED